MPVSTMPGTHDKLIAAAAKRLLRPLGLRRKGQSRLWIGDNNWWLTVVEFQPSGFQKGSYLNVAAHWLWSDSGFISFNFGTAGGVRAAVFEKYISDEQFAPAANRLAVGAAHAAQELARSLPSIEAAATLLLNREANLSSQSKGSWSTYHAGIAAGLAGREREADDMFRSVTDDRVRGATERLIPLLADPARFRAAVSALIAGQRQALRLPQLAVAPF